MNTLSGVMIIMSVISLACCVYYLSKQVSAEMKRIDIDLSLLDLKIYELQKSKCAHIKENARSLGESQGYDFYQCDRCNEVFKLIAQEKTHE